MIAVLFEVMDKELSITEIWLSYLVVGVIGFFLCHYRLWLIAPVVIFTLIFFPALLPQNQDELIRQAILQEAGENYYCNSYPAVVITIVLPIIGALLHVKNYKKQPTQ